MRDVVTSMKALPLVLMLLCGCSSEVVGLVCVGRTDCARNETCSSGRCVPTAALRSPGVIDAGELADASAPDAAPPAADAGGGCANVEVMGGAMFCTIAEAIAAAQDGATVMIPAGRYDERVRITRAIDVRGRGSSGAAITQITAVGAEPVIQISAPGASVSHLVVSAPNARGFQIAASSRLTAVSVDVAVGAGVYVTGAATVDFETVLVGGVLFTDQVRSDDGAGIVLEAGVQADISGGAISGCAGPGIAAHGATLTLNGTDVSANGAGLVADGPSDVTLRASAAFTGNRSTGVSMTDGRLDLQTVNSSDNEGDGVRFLGGATGTVSGCAFSANRGWGIFCAEGRTPEPCANNIYTGNSSGQSNCSACER